MAGKLEKVNTFTDSSATSLTLGSIFSADYNFYNVYIRGGMVGVSDIAAERPKLKVLTAAGAEFSTGIYDFTSFELNGSNITDNNANADQDNSVLNILATGGNTFSAHLKVFNPLSTTFYKYIWAACIGSGGYNKVGTMVKSQVAAGGLKIEVAGNTFDEIHAAVYGIKHT